MVRIIATGRYHESIWLLDPCTKDTTPKERMNLIDSPASFITSWTYHNDLFDSSGLSRKFDSKSVMNPELRQQLLRICTREMRRLYAFKWGDSWETWTYLLTQCAAVINHREFKTLATEWEKKHESEERKWRSTHLHRICLDCSEELAMDGCVEWPDDHRRCDWQCRNKNDFHSLWSNHTGQMTNVRREHLSSLVGEWLSVVR